jgi:hypothetical protein
LALDDGSERLLGDGIQATSSGTVATNG